MADEETRSSITDEYETAYISDLDPNPAVKASDILPTENKEEKGYKTTVGQVAALVCGITGTCTTDAATQKKNVILTDYDDTVLPREFDVLFTHKNSYGDTTATTPTYPTMSVFNKSNVELAKDVPIGDSRGHYAGSGCWNDGDTMTFRAMSDKVCIINSDIRQLTSEYIILSDNTFVYSKSQTDTKIDTEISGLSGANIQATYEGETDYINNVLTKVGKVKTVNEQEPDENGNIEIDADSTIPSMTTAEYDELTDEEKNDGHIREITDSVGTPIPFAVLNDELVTSSNVYSAQKTMLEIAKTTTYSEEEKVVGKWIDGKPIYRRVFTGLNQTIDASWTNANNVQLSNVNEIISGSLYADEGSSGGGVQVRYVNVGYLSGNVRLYSSQNVTMQKLSLEYTKTTD